MTDKENNHRIDNIEFNVTDIERAKTFYGAAFGWTFKDYGPSYCEFSDGRLTGGFAKAEAANPGGALVILYTDDLEMTRRRLKEAGAVMKKADLDFPGGRRLSFQDPEGYELAVWTDK